MSVIQEEDLVSYRLRTSYLSEVGDGVGERLITLNESLLNSAPFKATGWKANPAITKRIHSPPIPTAIASEYFQAQRVGIALEDEADEGDNVLFAARGVLGSDSLPAATKRARRHRAHREMDDDDSSDLSDESDDESEQRMPDEITFAKLPLRTRSGSSPVQSSSNLRLATKLASPRAAPAPTSASRHNSHSALQTVKERNRSSTVTSSEMSSENELDPTASTAGSRIERRRPSKVPPVLEPPASAPAASRVSVAVSRQGRLLVEDDDSDGSDLSSAFGNASIDSASLLDVVDNPIDLSTAAISSRQTAGSSPASVQQIVGTPPREFTRRSTVRRIPPKDPNEVAVLPPPRPISIVRPPSMAPPKGLLTTLLKGKKLMPFERFAALSGKGDPNPISIRIFTPFSKTSSKPFEVMVRRKVADGDSNERHVTVAELIGLSLWRFVEEELQPPIPTNRMNVNWWTLRMVEDELGDVDPDFPPLERTKPLISFATNNESDRTRGKPTRSRANSKPYDYFALVEASMAEFEENQNMTPEYADDEPQAGDDDTTPKATPQPRTCSAAPPPPPPLDSVMLQQRGMNPLLNTTYRPLTGFPADLPRQQVTSNNASKGKQKLLHIHIMSGDVATGQMMTLEVTTDMYLEDVLNLACKRRQLDKAVHMLRLPNGGPVAFLDRTVSSIGHLSILELHRRRPGTDGPLMSTGSLGSSAPGGKQGHNFVDVNSKKGNKKSNLAVSHVFAAHDDFGAAPYKQWILGYRQGPMRLVTSERILAIDGEYIRIMPSSSGKIVENTSKPVVTVHFSIVVGCKVSRKHSNCFKLILYHEKADSKRYDFDAKSPGEAQEIVGEVEKGIAPYRRS